MVMVVVVVPVARERAQIVHAVAARAHVLEALVLLRAVVVDLEVEVLIVPFGAPIALSQLKSMHTARDWAPWCFGPT